MAAQADLAHRRLALLIATSDYHDPALRQLRAPGRDASDLAEVLGASQIGGFTVQTLINARCGELLEAIEEFCADRRPDDQLLIYLSCHGVLDDRGRLYYAATDTRRQRTAATAVAAAWLNERLEDCRARSQIIILDCCHSGAFASGAKGQPDLALEQRFKPHGRGRVVLTASRGTEYSFEGDEPSGEGVQSVFTRAIVDGLRTGDADRDKDGLITVTDIYHHVYERVRAAEPRQTPELWTYGAEGDVLLAYSVQPVPLPEDLRVTLESPRPRVRETAVAELADLLDSDRPGIALSARQALQRISDEDIPRVAAVARVALEASEGMAAHQVSKELADREQAQREAEQAARQKAEEQAQREAEQSARQKAEEQALQEALRDKAKTPGQIDEDFTNAPVPEPGLGEGAQRAHGARPARRVGARRLVIIAGGAGIAVIGLLTAIIIASGTPHSPSTTSSSSSSSSSATGTSSGSSTTVSISQLNRTFSAMSLLKPLAAAGKGNVAAILPDTVSSARYVEFDAPYLSQALATSGLNPSQYSVVNAQGSDAAELSDAQEAITKGASVLIMDPLDSGVGAQIESYAKAHGVAVIDYDRLTLGGSRSYYVSFNNVEVGTLIGQGFVSCATAWHVSKPNVLVMRGDPTDNNATLFAQGYDAVLQPYFSSGKYVDVGTPAGTWDPPTAESEYQQEFTAHKNINSVLTPNDETAAPIINYLQTQGVHPDSFPVTGQDATLVGLQNILAGYQCGTVYKPIYLEAQAAVALAMYVRAGKTPPSSLVNGQTTDSQTNSQVSSVLLNPTWVTTSNMNSTVIADQFVTAQQLCARFFTAACRTAGISLCRVTPYSSTSARVDLAVFPALTDPGLPARA